MIRLLSLPIPCIAAINGHAYGGGTAFAFSHDYRIMRIDRGLFTTGWSYLLTHSTRMGLYSSSKDRNCSPFCFRPADPH